MTSHDAGNRPSPAAYEAAADRFNDAIERNLGSAIDRMRSNWGWIVAYGVTLILVGLIAAFNLVAATLAVTLLVGIAMFIGGCGELALAFRAKDWSGRILWALAGLIYILAAVVIFANPLVTSTLLTLLLGVALMVVGALRLLFINQLPKEASKGWLVTAAILTILVGLAICVMWPGGSLTLLGAILAIDLLFSGTGWVALGLRLKPSA